MDVDTAIRFDNVTKTYPAYHHITGGFKNFLFNFRKSLKDLRNRSLVLDGISLEIKKGECFGFIGRNGAGKSTSLGLMAGVLTPDSGRVAINGRVSPLLELGAGFHPELTGRENIILNGVLMGLNRVQVQAQLDEIIEFSGLGDFIDQPIRTYSSGMYAKLGFSIVSNLSPEILLIDEVLSVGDHVFVQKCLKKIEQFRADANVTLVLVSHDHISVKTVCDRAVWIENHRVKLIGPADEVVDAYLASCEKQSS